MGGSNKRMYNKDSDLKKQMLHKVTQESISELRIGIVREKMDITQKEKVKAVDFCLVDTHDQQVHLSDFLGKKPVVLVFNRGFA